MTSTISLCFYCNIWGIPYNNRCRKEVIILEDFGKDLAIALVAVIAAKALDELVEVLKHKTSKKTPKTRGKHSKRS